MASRSQVFISVVGDSSGAVRAFQAAERELGRLGVAAAASSSVIGNRLQKAGERITGVGKTASRAGRSLTRSLTLPLAAAGVGAAKLALNFEDSLTKIESLVGVSREQVEAWGREILRLGPRLAKGPQELADALFFITGSGIKGAAAMDVLAASAKASAAGLGETKVVADAVTSAVNAYGIKSLAASTATDVLVATVREGKGEADSFAGAIGRVIPLASETGVEFHEVGAALAAMTRTGLDANESVTALRGFLAALLKPTAQGRKELKKLGLAEEDLAELTGALNLSLTKSGITIEQLRDTVGRKGLFAGMQLLKAAIGDNRDALGKIIPNVRALTGFLSITGENASENAEIFRKLAASTGDTDKAFSIASKTAKFKFGAALSSLQAAGIKAGNVIIPVFTKIAAGVGRLAERFSRLSPASQRTILKIGAALLVLGPGLRIVGALVSPLGRLVGALGKFVSVSKTAGIIKGIGAALGALGISGPGLLVAGTIAGIAGAFLILRGRTDNATAALRRYRDAARESKDATLSLQDAVLGTKQADLAVIGAKLQLAVAQKELNRLQREGQKGSDEYKAAELGVKEAELALEQATRDQARARDAETKARIDSANKTAKAQKTFGEAIAAVSEEGRFLHESLKTSDGTLTALRRNTPDFTAAVKDLHDSLQAQNREIDESARAFDKLGRHADAEKLRATRKTVLDVSRALANIADLPPTLRFDILAALTLKIQGGVSQFDIPITQRLKGGAVEGDTRTGILRTVITLPSTTIKPKPLPEFAHGGIVTRPTLALVGEGAEDEAVIPLDSARARRRLGGFGGMSPDDRRALAREIAAEIAAVLRELKVEMNDRVVGQVVARVIGQETALKSRNRARAL